MEKSILTKDLLKKIHVLDDEGRMYQILHVIHRFIRQGIQTGSFTMDDAHQDLELALWIAYADNNIDDYEHYVDCEKWLKRVEQKAKGCGTWYYRYSVALMYLGRLKEALAYAKQGVMEEPDYPWGWLCLSSLQNHFGDKAGALDAVAKGLALVPGDYEFLTRRKEIEEGKSLPEMENHFIREEDDQKLMQMEKESTLYREKQLSISTILCDAENLSAVKAALAAGQWEADAPYCHFAAVFGKTHLNGRFEMNEAAVSKFDAAWILHVKASFDDFNRQACALLQKTLGQNEVSPVLTEVAFFRDHSFALCYQREKSAGSAMVFFKEDFQMQEEPYIENVESKSRYTGDTEKFGTKGVNAKQKKGKKMLLE